MVTLDEVRHLTKKSRILTPLSSAVLSWDEFDGVRQSALRYQEPAAQILGKGGVSGAEDYFPTRNLR